MAVNVSWIHEPPGADRQGGEGGSTPFMIYTFRDPRGKRATARGA